MRSSSKALIRKNQGPARFIGSAVVVAAITLVLVISGNFAPGVWTASGQGTTGGTGPPVPGPLRDEIGSSILGVVTESDGITPIAGIEVRAHFAEGLGCCEYVTTSATGEFELSGLVSGEYRLRAQDATGTFLTEWFSGNDDFQSASDVSVDGINFATGIDFVLERAGSISGIVTAADGTMPIEEASITVYGENGAGGAGCCWTATSAADGTYRIAGLPTGDYELVVYPASDEFAPQWFTGRTDRSLADSVSVTAPAETTGTNFALTRLGSISGTVTADDGITPLENVAVRAQLEPGSGYLSTTTAADGTYTILGLRNGDYYVAMDQFGYEYEPEWYFESADSDGATTVTVTEPGDSAEIDFTATRRSTLSGVVTDAGTGTPLSGLRVYLSQWSGPTRSDTTNLDGSYEISGLPADDYTLRVDVGRDSPYRDEWYQGKYSSQDADVLTVPAASDVVGINMEMHLPGSISGRVLETDGTTPIERAVVRAVPVGGGCCYGSAETETDGTYSIPGLVPGDYHVYMRERIDSQWVEKWYPNEDEEDTATAVTVSLATDTPGIDLVFDVGGSISGRVTATDGVTPLPGVDVRVDLIGDGYETATTDPDGYYHVNRLDSGDYKVRAPSYSNRDGVLQEWYDGRSEPYRADPVTINSTETVSGIDFTLDAGGVISGIVTREDGVTPVVGARVNAYSADGLSCCWRADSAADGTYVISGLTAGDYRVQVLWTPEELVPEWYSDSSFFIDADTVTVNASGTTSGVDFALAATAEQGSISGRVTGEDRITPVSGATVEVYSFDGFVRRFISTNSQGQYSITGLDSGDYRVRVIPNSSNRKQEEWYRDRFNFSTANSVTVLSPLETPDINFALGSLGVISGRVTEQDGLTPYRSAYVTVQQIETSRTWSIYTDAEGSYRVEGLPTGEYRVKIEHRYGGDFEQQWYDDQTLSNSADPVFVLAPDKTQGIDFKIRRTSSVSGTVTRTDGTTPIRDVRVTLTRLDGSFSTARDTSADGTYSFAGLKPGDYMLKAERRYGSDFLPEWFQERASEAEAETLVLPAETALEDINFTLESRGRISGRVTESDGTTPVSGARVKAETIGGGCCSEDSTDSNGDYEIVGLGDGDYRVFVESSNGYFKVWYDDASSSTEADPLTIVGETELTGIDLSLDRKGGISGIVYEADGTTPKSGVTVEAYNSSGDRVRTDRSNHDGTYEILGLGDGDYRLRATFGSFGFFPVWYPAGSHFYEATPVTVTAPTFVSGIDFVNDTRGVVEGTVTEADGTTPISGARIRIYTVTGFEVEERASDSDGHYHVYGLDDGQYRVYVDPYAYYNKFEGEWFEDADSFPLAQDVDVSSAAPSVIDFSLVALPGSGGAGDPVGPPDPGAIAGKVTEADGVTPIPDASVSIRRVSNGSILIVKSAADGTYMADELEPGEYTATATANVGGIVYLSEHYQEKHQNEAPDEITVLTAATTPGVDFTLDRSPTITGFVHRSDGKTPVYGVDVWAEPVGGGSKRTARANGVGAYQITGLEAGDYVVSARPSGSLNALAQWYDSQPSADQADTVSVTGGGTASGIDFNLESTGAITGQITDAATGLPLPNITVRVQSVGSSGSYGYNTNIAGFYRIERLDPGDYYVRAESTSMYLERWYEDANSIAGATAVSVLPSATTMNIDLALDDAPATGGGGSGGSIVGRATLADGGAPVANVFIRAYSADGFYCCSYASTGSDGTYSISNLSPGEYRLSAEGPNTGIYRTEWYGETDAFHTSTIVVVTDTEATTGIDFQRDRYSSISGRVTQLDGTTPISGARVSVYSYDGFICCQVGTTDNNGNFKVAGLNGGEYRVMAEKTYGNTKFTQWFSGRDTFIEGDKVIVPDAQNVAGIDLQLGNPGAPPGAPPTGSISGKITESDGITPIPNAEVRANGWNINGNWSTQSASDGTYLIEDIPTGQVRVEAFVYFSNDYMPGSYQSEALVQIVAPNETTGIDIVLKQYSAISGTVTDESGVPVVDVTVRAGRAGSGSSDWTRTNIAGRYTFTRLGEGDYTVRIDPGWRAPYVPEWYENKASEDEADHVAVVEGETTANVDLVVGRTGSLSGYVTEADGTTPITGVTVYARPVGGSGEFSTTTTIAGYYEIVSMQSGDYTVFAGTGYNSEFIPEWYDGAGSESGAQAVTVTAPGQTPGIDLSLDRLGGITGTVTEDDGVTPVNNITVRAYSADGSSCCNTVRTRSDGTYEFERLNSGDYRIAIDEGSGSVFYPEWYSEAGSFIESTVVSVTAPDIAEDIDFTLSRRGTISGTVLDEQGNPVYNVDVRAYSYDGFDCCWNDRTDSNGNYTIERLDAGDYRVVANESGHTYDTEWYEEATSFIDGSMVSVAQSGNTTGIDFTIRRQVIVDESVTGTISGTVTRDDTGDPVAYARVRAYGTSGSCCWSDYTDTNGSYTIPDVPPGDYRVNVDGNSNELVDEWYDDSQTEQAADIISVADNQDVTGIDVSLGRTGSLSGIITLADGVTPVVNTQVIMRRDGSGSTWSTTTNIAGRYRFSGLQDGTYYVGAQPRWGSVEFFEKWYQDALSDGTATPIAVNAPNERTDINIMVDRPGSVSGMVTEINGVTPIHGVSVTVRSVDNTFSKSSQTTIGGIYRVSGLPTGDYRVTAGSDRSRPEHISETSEIIAVTAPDDLPGIDFSLGRTGAISGKVLADDGFTPVSDVSIYLRRVTGSFSSYCCERTADDGTFLFTGLSSGDYKIEARPNDGQYKRQWFNGKSSESSADRITVTAPHTADNIVITLERLGSISGTVLDHVGDPVPGTRVYSHPFGGGSSKSDTTDVNGEYTIVGLTTGDYRLRADPPGVTLIDEWYDGQTTEENGDVVSVVEPDDTPGINFTLKRTGTISGTVTDAATGTPIYDASVRAERFDGSGDRWTNTDANGNYQLIGVDIGNYAVRVTPRDSQEHTTQWYSGKSSMDDADPVSVSVAQDVVGIDFELTRPGGISGIVTESDGLTPIPDASVRFYSATNGSYRGSVSTAFDGSYTFRGLADDDYQVNARPPDDRKHIGEWYDDQALQADSNVVPVVAPAITTGIDFTLKKTGSISGTVTEEDGVTPIRGAQVRLEREGGSGCCWSANTTIAGRYRVEGLSDGQYRLRVSGPNGNTYLSEWFSDSPTEDLSDLISVVAPIETMNINVSLARSGSISGTVTLTDGITPAEDVRVIAELSDGSACCWSAESTIAGTYRIEGLASGEYIVRAVPSHGQDYVEQWYSLSHDSAGALPVVVEAPGEVGNINFALALLQPPVILNIDIASGPIAGGTQVQINGLNFSDATGVRFGGTLGTDFQVLSDISITVKTPQHTAGVADVVVLHSLGDAVGVGLFTFVDPQPTPTPTPTPGNSGGGGAPPPPPPPAVVGPQLVVPDPPIVTQISAGDGTATIVWEEPSSDGGTPITDYRILNLTQNSPLFGTTILVSSLTRSHTVTGLVNGVTYTFQLTALNSVGSSSPTPIDPVTPVGSDQNVEEAAKGAFGGHVSVISEIAEIEEAAEGVTAVIPATGVTEGQAPIAGLSFETDGLTVTTDESGIGTASLVLSDDLMVSGTAQVVGHADGIAIEFLDSTLVYSPMTDSGSGDESLVTFEVAVTSIGPSSALTTTFDPGLADDILTTTFFLQGVDSEGTIADVDEDVAFSVSVSKTDLDNTQLGDNTVAMRVSSIWYEAMIQANKLVSIVKVADDGESYVEAASCVSDGAQHVCSVTFMGIAGGFSKFTIVALTLASQDAVVPATTVATSTIGFEAPGDAPTPVAVASPTATAVPPSTPVNAPTPTPTSTTTPMPTPTPGNGDRAVETPTATAVAGSLPTPQLVVARDGGGGLPAWIPVIGGLLAVGLLALIVTKAFGRRLLTRP